MSEIRISAIMPVHNAARCVGRSLAALRSSLPADAELLVVDDASTDNTADLARSRDATVHTIAKNVGPSQARNLGASKARGDYLLFVDADVAVYPDVVSRARDTLDRHPEWAAVFGSYDDRPAEADTVSQYRNLLHHYVHQRGNPDAFTFWAGCGAIRKSVFVELGGFDAQRFPRSSIEDIELGYRLRDAGHRIRLDKSLLCTHLKRWTVASMVRTDVFFRALPWARLNMERNDWPEDLNITARQKLSVALAMLVPIALMGALFHPLGLLAGIILLACMVCLNGDFFAFLVYKRGSWFAFRCVPLHLLHLLCSGFGYAWALLSPHRFAEKA